MKKRRKKIKGILEQVTKQNACTNEVAQWYNKTKEIGITNNNGELNLTSCNRSTPHIMSSSTSVGHSGVVASHVVNPSARVYNWIPSA